VDNDSADVQKHISVRKRKHVRRTIGNDIFVRLSEENRRELLADKGASYLEPMKGKPMKEYVVIPKAWMNKPETIRLWLSRSLDSTGKLPTKTKK
jgi:hypothetical protein